MIDGTRLTELSIRVMRDYVPLEPDMTYLVAQTRDNQDSVLHQVAEEIARPVSGKPWILLSNNVDAAEAISGYPGAKAWKSELCGLGFAEANILTFDVHGPANTLTEMIAMVRCAKALDLREIRLIASPFHQLRSFITAVSVLLKEYPALRVYNKVGKALDWNESARHSQGERSDKRSDLVAKELARIHAYHEKGDLVDIETVLEYLDRRDLI